MQYTRCGVTAFFAAKVNHRYYGIKRGGKTACFRLHEQKMRKFHKKLWKKSYIVI